MVMLMEMDTMVMETDTMVMEMDMEKEMLSQSKSSQLTVPYLQRMILL